MGFALHILPTWILPTFFFLSFTFVHEFSSVYATTECVVQYGFMYRSLHKLLTPQQEKLLPETSSLNM